MPAKTGSRNGLSYGWALGENNWNTGMDGNLAFIDRFGVHLSFKSFLNTPPGSPAAGDCYVIGSTPTGAWVGKAGQVAVYDDGAWRYGAPRTGWQAYCEADEQQYVYDGGWVPAASEWSAATVDQAEAEAGTATTRRAWTAERVKQAIAGWWESVKGAIVGPIGITANSSSPALTITQTGTGNAFVVEDSASPDSTPFLITASGQVVKGHTAPITVGQTIAPTVQIHETIANSGFGACRWSDNPGGPNALRSAKSRGTSIGTSGAVQSGDNLGVISFDGDDGAAFIPAAQISAIVDATNGTGSMPGRLVFSTTPSGSSTPVAAMRIDSQQVVVDQAGVAQTPTRSTVASGSTITLTTGTNHLLYDQAATVADLTVTLPSANLTNGRIITICTRSDITALTINGGTIYGVPTTLAAGGFCSFIYSSAASAWFRRG